MTQLSANPYQDLSLLWPGSRPSPQEVGPPLPANTVTDLGVERIVTALAIDPAYQAYVRSILLQMNTTPEIITYRQDILDDLRRSPALVDSFRDVLAVVLELAFFSRLKKVTVGSTLYQTLARLGELDLYVDCVNRLATALRRADTRLQAAGLQRLRDALELVAGEPSFKALASELPELVIRLRKPLSVTIGVNLDERFRPVEATILAIHDQPVKAGQQTLFGRLFGKRDDPLHGITPLHSVPFKTSRSGDTMADRENPLLYPLFKDLDGVLNEVAKPIADALRRYQGREVNWLVSLAQELAFYVGAIQLNHSLEEQGLPLCRPVVASMEQRLFQVEAHYNLALALRLKERGNGRRLGDLIVTNDTHFGPQGWIAILTGPNQGGKTTYTEGIGLSQLLFQAGLFVPGRQATISPADGIFTHFATEEKPEQDSGRLGEEARRVSDIFRQATGHSLVLLNETFSSTSPTEAFSLAYDVVRVLRLMGARAIFTTHLHELAINAEAINGDGVAESEVFNLVAGIVESDNGQVPLYEARRTYKIGRGAPLGTSYARDVAARYGMSFEQLTAVLRERQLLG
jgi:hypothetical protein